MLSDTGPYVGGNPAGTCPCKSPATAAATCGSYGMWVSAGVKDPACLASKAATVAMVAGVGRPMGGAVGQEVDGDAGPRGDNRGDTSDIGGISHACAVA